MMSAPAALGEHCWLPFGSTVACQHFEDIPAGPRRGKGRKGAAHFFFPFTRSEFSHTPTRAILRTFKNFVCVIFVFYDLKSAPNLSMDLVIRLQELWFRL